jgi:hypothetical protein
MTVIGPATGFALSAPSGATAGAAFSVTATATDAIGDVAVFYAATVSLTSTSSTGVVTALGSYKFTTADQGVHVFSVKLTTAGTQSLTATDANGLVGSDPSLVISAAAASQFVFTSYPASITARTPFSVTIEVADAYGNVITGYTGTAHFKDTAGYATLPKNYTFKAGDQGIHTFTGLILRKKGSQTLKVSDTKSSSIAGSLTVDVL